jgi:hypothetical protein
MGVVVLILFGAEDQSAGFEMSDDVFVYAAVRGVVGVVFDVSAGEVGDGGDKLAFFIYDGGGLVIFVAGEDGRNAI